MKSINAETIKADRWISENYNRIERCRLEVIRCDFWAAAVAAGVWFDLRGEIIWGRVTLWPGGKADLEQICAISGKSVLYRDDVAFDASNLTPWLQALEASNKRSQDIR